jgi:hypothetical protein
VTAEPVEQRCGLADNFEGVDELTCPLATFVEAMGEPALRRGELER